MSQNSRSWFADNPVLTLILAVAGLWLGWKVLVGIFLLLAHTSKSLFLLLDASYGQAGGIAGYALLGLLLGAAAGAAAAQRRFRLNRGILLGAVVLAVAAVSVVYAGSRWADGYSEAAPDYTAPAAAGPLPETPVAINARVEAPATAVAQPDTMTQAVEEFYTVSGTLHLLPDWRDSSSAGLTYRSGTDTLRLYRRTSHWGLVTPLLPEGQPRVYSGWIPLSQLTHQVSARQPIVATRSVSGGIGATVTEKATADSTQATEEAPAPASHPVGSQQHDGQVGSMAAQFSLNWQDNGEVSGTYHYAQQPAIRYRLTGTATAAGELRLLEFTRGRQSARCVLQREDDHYLGTMYNADGQQFPMRIQVVN